MKQILLRFRDTDINNTIDQHLSVIKRQGKVWWGWWKKESEPSRREVLEELSNNINGLSVLLFNRATDKYYQAYVISIDWAKTSDLISCPNKDLCPPYYNNIELPAWFCFNSIKEISKAKFTSQVNVIPSIDYTFFIKQDLDPLPIERRVKLLSNHILHVSDIHFGSDHGFPLKSEPNKRALLDTIKDYISNNFDEKIGLLIISGDITSRADANILQGTGLHFINELVKILEIEKEAVIIIPGNHDIPIKDANFYNYEHETSFRIFLKEFYGYPKELYGLEYFELPSGENIDILRINSIRLRKKEESNYGYVEISLYGTLLKELRKSNSIKMAVMHHHLVSMPVEETLDTSYPYGSISVTIDSGRVIEGLHKAGIKLVLNGHQHISGITKIARGIINDSNEIDSLSNDLYILSAGSAGAKSERLGEHMKYNSFSVYTINSKNTIEINCQFYNSSKEPKKYFKSTISF